MDIRLDAPPVDPTDFPLTWCLKQMSACGSYSQEKPLLKVVLALNTALRLTAQRGDFVARRHDGEPEASDYCG